MKLVAWPILHSIRRVSASQKKDTCGAHLRGLLTATACGVATCRRHTNRFLPSSRRQGKQLATMKRAAENTFLESQEIDGDPSRSVPGEKKPRKRLPPPPPPVVPPSLMSTGSDDTSHEIWQSAMLLVDKPKTWTSFDVCGKIRNELGRAMNVKPRKIKVGHAGTLDPMATGLLIVCVGKGTKSIDTLMGMPKEYSGTMKLGETTDSYDADGEVVSTQAWQGVSVDQLEAFIREQFVGEIRQVPPMFSALKQGGKKLCDLAREGKEVPREARGILVERYDLTREDPSSPMVDYYVRCSKGTYIRCLAHDLGQAAGCGAHLVALRREKIGEFDVKHAWQIDDLIEFIRRFGGH